MFTDASSNVLDAWQRSVLFLDLMRQRAIQYRVHAAEDGFQFEDDRSWRRPRLPLGRKSLSLRKGG